jgi:hypothetical protein
MDKNATASEQCVHIFMTRLLESGSIADLWLGVTGCRA